MLTTYTDTSTDDYISHVHTYKSHTQTRTGAVGTKGKNKHFEMKRNTLLGFLLEKCEPTLEFCDFTPRRGPIGRLFYALFLAGVGGYVCLVCFFRNSSHILMHT